MEKTRSGGIEFGAFASTARSTYAKAGASPSLARQNCRRVKVSLPLASRRSDRGLSDEMSELYLVISLFILAILGASFGYFEKRKSCSPSMSASVTAPFACTYSGLKKRTDFMRASCPPRLPSIDVSKYLAAGETTARARAISTSMLVRSELESRCVSDSVGAGTAERHGGDAPSSNASRRSPCYSNLDTRHAAVAAYLGLPVVSSCSSPLSSRPSSNLMRTSSLPFS
eukprot:5666435-Prymnesium_polylepis.1